MIGLLVLFAFIAGAASHALVARLMPATSGRPVKRRLAVAEKALRAIANGAGAPELEAQIALQELTDLEG